MESKIIKEGLQNSIFVLFAQTVKFALGISRALVLPIILGVSNFGYWQIYLLYVGYAGVFTLGFNDGVYLKYGRYNYDELPNYIFRSTFKIFFVLQLAFSILLMFPIMFEVDIDKKSAMILAALNIPILGLSGSLSYILQITNQLKKYSLYTILDQVMSITVILAALLLQTNHYLVIVMGDILSKLVVLGLMLVSCKELIFGKGVKFKTATNEFANNVKIGIKLMLANMAGMLVLGFGRIIIERFKSVEDYGVYSFAISTLNLVLIFSMALGTVIYPTLSRIEVQGLSKIFEKMADKIQVLTLCLLLSFFPLKYFIENFMGEYYLIFEYLPVIFAIGYVQSKMHLLINPFYKLLREEKAMLNANIIGLIMAVLFVSISFWYTNSIFMVAASTLLAMTIRLILSEKYLKKVLNIKQSKEWVIECLVVGAFIFLSYQKKEIVGLIGFLIIIILFWINIHYALWRNKKI